MDTSKTLLEKLKLAAGNSTTAGLVMMLFAGLAMIVANSGAAGWYVGITGKETHFWVNDVLMVLFFFVIGMELKHEVKQGCLSRPKDIGLPLVAAICGMAVPAAIYLFVNAGTPENIRGWAIASATDIAFAVAILGIFGKGIPNTVRVFLLAVAIFDDLGAIIVIAAFYTDNFEAVAALNALAVCGILYLLNARNVANPLPYVAAGAALWFCFHEAGIHTTLAGVLTGLAIPMNGRKGEVLKKVEHRVKPFVDYFVLPLFAFTAAGVSLQGFGMESLLQPLPLGIMLGLFAGKQIGIFGISYAAIKTKLLPMPEGANWIQIYAVSVIAGIGFTMSLFIGLLAFDDHMMQDMVRAGVLAGSLISVIWGAIILKMAR